MRKTKVISTILVGIMLAGAMAGCGGKNQVKKDFSSANLMVGAYRDLRTDPYNNSYGIGADKFMKDYEGSSVQFTINNSNEKLAAAVSSGDVWDIQLLIGVSIPGVFDQNLYMPIDKYIDINNPIYTKELMEKATKYYGKMYGIGNIMMSDFYYAAYNETLYNDYGIKTPAQYYKEGKWNRESFLQMIDDLKKNQIPMNVNFGKPSLTATYAVEYNQDGTVSLGYDKVPNRDWLTFVKNIVYDKKVVNAKGSVAQRQLGFKQDILPHILVDAVNSNSQDQVRYIPFLIKENPISTYLVEYYFALPNGSKNPEASIELSNYMIEACVEDRTKMFKDNMTPEDYEIFTKTGLEDYYITRGAGVGPKDSTVKFLQEGGAVSTLISQNLSQMNEAVEKYNQQIKEQQAQHAQDK